MEIAPPVFELVINLKAAKALGNELKFALVARVNRMIQSQDKMSAGTKPTSELWPRAALRQQQTFGRVWIDRFCIATIT